MKKLLFITIATFLITACSNSDSEEKEFDEILTGSFTEISPIKERVNLEYLSETQLRQQISDYSIVPTFTIKLVNNNQLELSCNECDESESQIVSYRIINNNTFEIGGFFPAESSELMIFERN